MSIAVVGSLGLDTIHTPAGRVEDVLGGSAAYFSLAARHFLPVSLVAVVGSDFPSEAHKTLEHPDVDLSGLEVREGRTFRWEGIYSANMQNRETIRTELNVFEQFRPKLAERLRKLPNIFLANIDPELQSEVLDQFTDPRLVLCDTMNYWIRHKREGLLAILRRVQILIINEEEARELTGEAISHKAARGILALGPKMVVVKQGEHGAFLETDGLHFLCPAVPLETVVDPTGAGDTFAGGFVGALARMGRLTEQNLRAAVVFGCVLASFTVEGFGVSGLVTASREEVLRRARTLLAITQFTLGDPAGLLR
jgi:sugar/nucleoside kinase (ribokinase family)